ncbi:MAG: RtcB family protein, partial [Actinomycetota bacterium]|nr:RtcB family protein [Actinomycetota bacterium]
MPTKTNNVLSWASDVEPATIEQATKAASLPFVDGHIALMPDAHIGIGATIGSVIPTRGAIIPAAVGVDIGCGMIAVESDLDAADLPHDLGGLLTGIETVVPAGLGKAHEAATPGAADIPAVPHNVTLTDKQRSTVVKQFGSLGSGNHFVEVCLDERDRVWVVLHSGSRGIGNQLAKIHIEAAKGLMKRYFIDLPDPDLAYLVEGSPEFDSYITAMLWSQEYALANRAAMMDAVLAQLWTAVGKGSETQRVNCHHNFTAMENHRGRNVWL